MDVSERDVRSAIRGLGLAGKPLCVHSSLRSFGTVEGGARTIVDGLLAEGCTVMVPTFSESIFSVGPPPNRRLARNGSDYDQFDSPKNEAGRRYSTDSLEVDKDMGAISAAVLHHPAHVRGDHPRDSFSAVGPLAGELISGQRPLDAYYPLRVLAENGGSVILMGVELNRMTLIHLAEQLAGRHLFRRWATGSDGRTVESEEGGCSEGFQNFQPALAHLERVCNVGHSRWRVYSAKETLHVATEAIRGDPWVTHCGDAGCIRCNDAVEGGPIFPSDLE